MTSKRLHLAVLAACASKVAKPLPFALPLSLDVARFK
jgi:hypothetical protein